MGFFRRKTDAGGEEIERLRKEISTLKRAFETTAADRDRLQEQVVALTDPLDAGYARIDFVQHFRSEDKEKTKKLSEQWEEGFREGRYGEVVRSIFEEMGIFYALEPREEYYKPLAAYYIACFFVRQHNFARARHYADQFYFEATLDGTDFLPFDLKQSTRQLRFRQDRAIAAGRPGAIIASLTKSASAYLSHAISDIFDVPVMHVSLGEAMSSVVIDRWVRQVARGGAVTHEHFEANAENIAALSRGDAKTVWVQIRDPRDASFSMRKMREASYVPYDDRDVGEKFVFGCRYMAGWIGDWLDASQRSDLPFRVGILTFDEVTQDLTGTLQRMFPDHMDEHGQKRLKDFLKQRPRNFRSGRGQEWRDFPDEFQKAAWDAIPPNVIEYMALDP